LNGRFGEAKADVLALTCGTLRVQLDRFDLIGWSDTVKPISRAVLTLTAFLIGAPFGAYVAIWYVTDLAGDLYDAVDRDGTQRLPVTRTDPEQLAVSHAGGGMHQRISRGGVSGEYTAAYVVGSTLGRHKLAPAISPRKTVEGAAAQLVASVLAAFGARAAFFTGLSMREAVVIGLLLGVTGQIGDLVESAIKRSVGTKDTGRLIPGHGGMLDRVDSLLLNTPVLFYYATYTRSLGS